MEALNTNLKGRKIILGLSGGVDSAVAALLLKQQGANVQALHMTNWEDDDGYCTAATDFQDARLICEQIDIPLHRVNFTRQYRNQVFKYFLDEYRVGRTPNPDVLCNREIKFGVFRDYSKRLAGELLATGHYARTKISDREVELWKAADETKDQSYFLSAVATDALADTLFPLGNLTKTDVRHIAHNHGLAVHNKKDSTGICFIGERPFREFLSTYLPANPGPIRTQEGKEIGQHYGLMYYTLGQRQGLGVGGRQDSSDEPWYVAGKILDENALIVVQGEHPMLYNTSMVVSNVNWIGKTPIKLSRTKNLSCSVKIRYRQPDQTCLIKQIDSELLEVLFEKEQRAIAPGQFAVFYDGDRCLGGATIEYPCARYESIRTAI